MVVFIIELTNKKEKTGDSLLVLLFKKQGVRLLWRVYKEE
jgi:hypothetical protein